MHIDQATLQVGELIRQVTHTEIRLPELQRSYVWRPTQVAKLVDSLYRGFPFGSLLFWQSDEEPATRAMAVAGAVEKPFKPPLYLLDGQQRLTSLHRVFTDHQEAQIVFHVEKERFQNQSAVTEADPNWIKVYSLLRGEESLISMIGRLRSAGCQLPDLEIERRLSAVRALERRTFHVEILRDCDYHDVSEIFVRVNSAGRPLSRADLAMSTLSARWPGVLEKFQKEAAHWRHAGYGDLDVDFLTRAFAAALFGGGMSSWSVSDLSKVAEPDLARAWDVVQRGLKALVHLLKSDLRLSRSESLPSLTVLIPLVVLLGERPDEPVDEQTNKALLYWLLIATVRARYSTSSDTNLTRDIQAVRKPEPVRGLLRNLGVLQAVPAITPDSIAGRSKESPYFFLSLLVAQRRRVRDWWYSTEIMPGEQDYQLQFHHVHPVATLERFDKGEINDLANLAFISRKANLKISDRSPVDYFPTVNQDRLTEHLIPVAEDLRAAEAFPRFLAERRRLLAEAMTELLASFRPGWLDQLPSAPATNSDGYKLTMVLYGSAWIPGTLVLHASGAGVAWSGSTDMDDFVAAITAATRGQDGDVRISDEQVPVQVVEDAIEVPIGPFVVSGTAQEWLDIIHRERAVMQAPGRMPAVEHKPWAGERIPLPAGSTD
ncbi:GmrSD restriction endonuclease domain-containing protein [Dactylosporangium salmoneum]|uniref:GmrSD restriction endonucleases N-terminal domain-containing protein n=1 Tax=Dactylosporangium salmoneum TaxID=53361 RepID=A0ABN3FTT3_9ACTN